MRKLKIFQGILLGILVLLIALWLAKSFFMSWLVGIEVECDIFDFSECPSSPSGCGGAECLSGVLCTLCPALNRLIWMLIILDLFLLGVTWGYDRFIRKKEVEK